MSDWIYLDFEIPKESGSSAVKSRSLSAESNWFGQSDHELTEVSCMTS